MNTDPAIIAAIATALAAIVATLTAFVMRWRLRSGTVRTTHADGLWEANERLIKKLEERLVEAEHRFDLVERRLQTCEEARVHWLTERLNLTSRLDQIERVNAEQRALIVELTAAGGRASIAAVAATEATMAAANLAAEVAFDTAAAINHPAESNPRGGRAGD